LRLKQLVKPVPVLNTNCNFALIRLATKLSKLKVIRDTSLMSSASATEVVSATLRVIRSLVLSVLNANILVIPETVVVMLSLPLARLLKETNLLLPQLLLILPKWT
jgi:hypothetical protein